jgi:hypothetical protein
MKDLEYYTRLVGSSESAEDTYLSFIQGDISGGRVPRQEIDEIAQFPNATEISISGFTQDTFEYFIGTYGQQFKAIIFWKCPLISDLRMLETLDKVEYLVLFWNQRAEKLWDFSKTKALKGLCYDDFTRMHDISQISASPALEELHFGDMIWVKYILNTLDPLKECTSLKNLSFTAKKILDGRIEPLATLKKLEKLSFPANLFTTEQVAWLKAHLPQTLNSSSLEPFWKLKHPILLSGKKKNTFITGKRKPFLAQVEDKARIKKYVQKFKDMHQWYLENPQAAPEDYPKAR